MSSGFTPPPWNPPQNQLNPLAIINLLQQKQEMEQRQQMYQKEREDKAVDSVMKGALAGLDVESLINAHPELPTNQIGMIKDIAKQVKKKTADEEALKQLPNFQAAAGQTLGPKGEVLAAPNIGAAQALYGGVSDELKPVFNLGVDARNAAVNAQSADIKRTADEAALASRRSLSNTLTGQANAAALSDQAARRAMDRDSLAEINASGDQEAIRKANETIIAGSTPAEAKRLIQRSWLDGQAVLAKRLLATRASPGGSDFAVKDALVKWNEGDRSPDTIATLQAKKLVMENPSQPTTLAGDPRTRWLWIEGQEQSIKGLTQMRGIDGMLNRLEDFGLAAEGATQQQKSMLHGLTGSQAMEMVNRGTAREGSLAASIGTILIELQKTFASVGNVGQITDFEQMMAARMGPWKTEILGANGKVSEGFKGRLAAGRDMVERARIAAVDPQVRTQLEQETRTYLSNFNPAQRDAIKAYRGATVSGDAVSIRNAEKRMDKTGATDISNRLNFHGDTTDRKRAESEADALMSIGPAGGAR